MLLQTAKRRHLHSAPCRPQEKKTNQTVCNCTRKEKKMWEISKCYCINWKQKTNLRFWTFHHRMRNRRKSKEGRERQGKNNMHLRRDHKEMWNVKGLFWLERVTVQERKEVHEIIKGKSAIPISSSHKTANNAVFHKTTIFSHFFFKHHFVQR